MPVDRDERQDLVLVETVLDVAVAVAPRPKLFGDPRRQPNRRIGQPERERLGLRPLNALVARLVDRPELGAPQVVALFIGLWLALLAWWSTGRVNAGDTTRVSGAKIARHGGAPIAAVGAKAFVAERVHQRDPEITGAGDVGPLGRLTGKAEAGNRRHDDVERVGCIAAVQRRVAQRPDRRQHLPDGAGPAVRHHEREGRTAPRSLMDEMEPLPFDRRHVVVEAVQLALVDAPVVLVAPVGDQLLEIRAVGAVRPRLARRIGRPARQVETVAQVVELLVGDTDLERLDVTLGGDRAPRQLGYCERRTRSAKRLQHAPPVDRAETASYRHRLRLFMLTASYPPGTVHSTRDSRARTPISFPVEPPSCSKNRYSKLHPHTAVNHSSVNRRPGVDSPPAIEGPGRAEEWVPTGLPHVRQVLAIDEQT